MVFEAAGTAELFLLARVLFGGVLAFTGLNHFMDVDGMSGYAEFKGLPAPRASVLLSGGLLIFGGLSLVAGVYPTIGAGSPSSCWSRASQCTTSGPSTRKRPKPR